ncbi:MAG TPA: acetamidase/formamidase family protein, partial [Rhodanobacteraceae bacterium]
MRQVFITFAIVATGGIAAHTAGSSHTLEPSPTTVAYGYYDAAAKPVLRIVSGDTIRIHTLITSTPQRLEAAGVAKDQIEPSLREIVEQVKDRGPGGHILTGPIYVEGAEPGDALEVKILSIDLPIDYGYNGCSGFLPENCDRSAGIRVIPLDRKNMTAEYMPGIVVPLKPFFGSMGV